MNETELRDIVWRHPECLGYDARSHSVRGFKWGDAAGISDVVIFPKMGPQIAIVEVKRAASDEANALVIGQLLKYYARALRMAAEGIQDIVSVLGRLGGVRHGPCSPAGLWGCSEKHATDRCQRGRLLGPEDIALHIVVDEAPKRMQLRLVRTCHALRKHHRLHLQLWRLSRLAKASSRSRHREPTRPDARTPGVSDRSSFM